MSHFTEQDFESLIKSSQSLIKMWKSFALPKKLKHKVSLPKYYF